MVTSSKATRLRRDWETFGDTKPELYLVKSQVEVADSASAALGNEEALKPIWQSGELIDPRQIDAVFGIKAEALPAYGIAKAAVYRWTFPDSWRNDAPQWLKSIEVVTESYDRLRILSYGFPRPELLRGLSFQEDPWDYKLRIARISASRNEQAPKLVVSLAGSTDDRLHIFPTGTFIYEPAPPQGGHSATGFPSGD